MTTTEAISLLKKLIATPSISREEEQSATLLYKFMVERGFAPVRLKNNILAYNKHFDESLSTVVLAAHHDTVRPSQSYTRDPFSPTEEQGRIYGLGSNDDGASLVAMMALFDNFYSAQGLKYNLCLALSAEEECSGTNGMEHIFPQIHNPSLVVVGEPTSMQVAIAERGLMVVDCTSEGVAGHAAHENTENAIVKTIKDIEWFSTYRFEKTSPLLGAVKMSVTIINAGSSHNIIPDKCTFTVDVRSNGLYTNHEILETIKSHVSCSVKERSTRLSASSIELSHPFVECCIASGSTPVGSSTLSDQALVSCPSVKIGIGDTLRSHTADEYIEISEIERGIEQYIEIFSNYLR